MRRGFYNTHFILHYFIVQNIAIYKTIYYWLMRNNVMITYILNAYENKSDKYIDTEIVANYFLKGTDS